METKLKEMQKNSTNLQEKLNKTEVARIQFESRVKEVENELVVSLHVI